MPVYAGMSQGSGFGPGIDGAAKALMYFAGGAILGGALAYGPISGLNYGPTRQAPWSLSHLQPAVWPSCTPSP